MATQRHNVPSLILKLHWQYQQLLDLLKMSSSRLAEFSSDQEAMEEEEETDEVEVLEECPKKPTASEVRSAIDVLTSYSLFVNEGVEEIRSHVQKIEALAERNFRSSQRQQTLLSFFGSKMQSPLNNKDQ